MSDGSETNSKGTVQLIQGSYYTVKLEDGNDVSNAKNASSVDIAVGDKVIVSYVDSLHNPIISGVYDKSAGISKDDLKNQLVELEYKFMDKSHPVGSYYWSDNNVDPFELFGVGTWQRITDTFLYAINDNETPGVKKTTSSVSLTTANMPVHTHIQNAHTHIQNAHGHTQTAHNHSLNYNQTATAGTNKNLPQASGTTNDPFGMSSVAPIIQNTTATNQNTAATNQNTGEGEAFDIMPPHRGAYCWKRIL